MHGPKAITTLINIWLALAKWPNDHLLAIWVKKAAELSGVWLPEYLGHQVLLSLKKPF